RWITYGISRICTWLGWRLMTATRHAVASNLHALAPETPLADCERRALSTFRAYGLDVIDFLRAIAMPLDQQRRLFEVRPVDTGILKKVLDGGRGMILVTAHYGNWEIGSVLMRVLGIPLTIVAMAETNPDVNRRRLEMRERLGADTIEVRQ